MLKKLFLKLLLLGIPFLAIVTIYILTDPFSLYFREDWPLRKVKLETSYDYTSTERYLNQHKKYNYNSFVFGNSRCYAFLPEEWKKWLDKDAMIFKWGEPGESIYNMRKKLELITENGQTPENVLLLLDFHIIDNPHNRNPFYQSPIYIHHPQTSSSTWIGLHESFFRYYITDYMFVRHLDYSLNGKYKPYMTDFFPKNALVEHFVPESDSDLIIHNQASMTLAESLLRNDSVNFIHKHVTDTIDCSMCPPMDSTFSEEDIEDLTAIAVILKSQHSNYKIIIGPTADQKRMNPANVKTLRKIFGAENVYDYSGRNSYSENPGNFYDNDHFRIHIAADILQDIYGEDK